MTDKHMIVTISHQLGCGGAALWQKLSEQLGILFFYREILVRVARELNLAEPGCRRARRAVERFLAIPVPYGAGPI
ncbi:MAG TPA: cytidylate kinase family protein [Anaerolineales bacterium]|nr:cytidylate kinase family protein [Anaerolineales bacterium]